MDGSPMRPDRQLAIRVDKPTVLANAVVPCWILWVHAVYEGARNMSRRALVDRPCPVAMPMPAEILLNVAR